VRHLGQRHFTARHFVSRTLHGPLHDAVVAVSRIVATVTAWVKVRAVVK